MTPASLWRRLWRRPEAAPLPAAPPTPQPVQAPSSGDAALPYAAMVRRMQMLDEDSDSAPKPFALPKPTPGVVPDGQATMAQDADIFALSKWASDSGAARSGMEWLGYTILSELAQRPEFRRIARVKANEMTRKWVRLESLGGESKSEELRQLTTAMRKFRVRDSFRRLAELDGYFGRGHLYIDTGATDSPDELQTPLVLRPEKIRKGGLKRLGVVEPIWTYPTSYNSSEPLRADFYKPQAWWVMGKKIHSSRLLTFIGREVPDIIKPSYMFGGMSLTQAALPYVELWLKDRTSVSELVEFFSTSVLRTDMRKIMKDQGLDGLIDRIEMWTQMRRNRDVFLVDVTEEFSNVSSPLGTLDKLQAQSQEHICSAIGMPLVKYTGITPSGLNASSDGEIRVWYDEVNADQEDEFRDHLEYIIKVIQLSEFGAIDEDITFEFVSLWQLDEAGKAASQQAKAAIAGELIDKGVVAPEEERERQAKDPDSIYAGVDLSGPPPPSMSEEDEQGDDREGPLAKSVTDSGAEGSETGANSGV